MRIVVASGARIQMQSRKLAQDRGLVKCFIHRRVAVAEPVLHHMNPQYSQLQIRRTTNIGLRIMRLDQGKQALSEHDLSHLDQEALAAGLLTFAGVLGIGEGHLFHRAQSFSSCEAGISLEMEILFRISLTTTACLTRSLYCYCYCFLFLVVAPADSVGVMPVGKKAGERTLISRPLTKLSETATIAL